MITNATVKAIITAKTEFPKDAITHYEEISKCDEIFGGVEINWDNV